MKLKIWDKKTTYKAPYGDVYTPERIFQEFPQAEDDVTVLTMRSENVFGAIEFMADLRYTHKDIDQNLSDEEFVAALQYKKDNPPPPSDDITPVTQSQVQLLGQLLNELNLNILEMGNT